MTMTIIQPPSLQRSSIIYGKLYQREYSYYFQYYSYYFHLMEEQEFWWVGRKMETK